MEDMILQDNFEFNQPNLEGGLDLTIHEEDVGPVRIHVQNLVVIPNNDNAIMDFRIILMILTGWCQGWWQCLK